MKGDCVDNSKSNQSNNVEGNAKDHQLEPFRVENEGTKMTTNQGLRVSNDEDSLKAGVRGPTIMEDFHLREKLPISIMSVFQSVLYMPEVLQHMASLNYMNPWQSIRKRNFCRIRKRKYLCLSDFRQW